MTSTASPDTPSSDYMAMLPYWDMVETLLGGAAAMRAAGEAYLPRFPNESDDDYEYRRVNAKFTNLFADVVANLAAKPFAEKLTLGEGASDRMLKLAEDIDGRGNNLHVFASNAFYAGVAYAVDWVLVDHTKVPRGASLETERRIGARPYWVRIPAKRMLAAYSAVVAGVEEIVHARLHETHIRRSGFSEATIERVRVFDREPVLDETGRVVSYAPATFQLWEKITDAKGATNWQVVDEGAVTIGVIPLVPFITGRRLDGSWRLNPPMRDAADLQVEHYQQETKLKCAADRTAFPLLAAEGVDPDRDEDGNPKPVSISPGSVVYAPPFGDNGSHGEWNFKEPSATSLQFLADQIATTEQQMRELGRQPLTAAQGITVVSAAYAGQKASNAVQAWAWGLKDTLEQALRFTAMWLRESAAPTVKVFTDFGIEVQDDKGPDWLRSMAERGRLSTETEWAEARRRNILSSDFDAELERERLLAEIDDAGDAGDMGAATTPPVDPADEPAPEDDVNGDGV